MSKVTTVFNAIVTKVKAALPNHVRLSNAYMVEDNPDLKLKLGFGVRLGSGENSRRVYHGGVSINRTLTVVLTRRAMALDNDPEKRAEGEKQIAEDMLLVIKEIDRDPTLNSTAMRTVYTSDSGVGFIFRDDGNYLFTEVSFASEYFEDLN